MKLNGRSISPGVAEGEVLFSSEAISFLGGVDAKTGIVTDKGSQLEGKCVAGKILVFPRGKGSTVGTYVIYQLKKNGVAPKAIINSEAEIIVAVGAIMSEIPMVDKIDLGKLKTGQKVKVDAGKGIVEVV